MGPSNLSVPALAVVTMADAPRLRQSNLVLQHLGILVGYQARGPKVMNTPILEVNCH